jgi:hypothetical protein
MANAIAFCEFGQLLRWSVFFKMGRRTAQHVPPGGKATDDETGIGRQRQPDRKVESLVDQIDGSLAHGQIDLGVGVGRQEFGGYRCDKRDDMGGRVDAKRTARCGLQGAGEFVGQFEIRKDLRAAIVIGLADFRETDLAGRAMEKPRAKPVLQRLDVVAHHRRRHFEPAAGRRKPAAVHYLDECRQTGQPINWRTDYPLSLDGVSAFHRIIKPRATVHLSNIRVRASDE